ncbi:LAFA_0C10770g1_1 [Lachancea sp. 'fantastica']|nr:LAFA_0C10770g1_1 [Lachancea sp. 'fantastica']
MTLSIPVVELKGTKAQLPKIGFGSGTKWRILKSQNADKEDYFIEELAEQVNHAIRLGFNHIDTAEAYKTYEEVGAGIRKSEKPRSELWVTDKYAPWSYSWNKSTGPLWSLKNSLTHMGLEYVDLYLLHSPAITPETSGITLQEAWNQMEQILESGLAKNIGVSNFDVESLQNIHAIAKHMPSVNQIEFHPYLQQQSPGIVDFCKQHEIVVEGYSPLAPLTGGKPGPLDEILPKLAEKYGKSELQILLNWSIQSGVVPITTSGNEARIAEILQIFDFKLDNQDVEMIAATGKQKLFRNFMKDLYGKYDEVLE